MRKFHYLLGCALLGACSGGGGGGGTPTPTPTPVPTLNVVLTPSTTSPTASDADSVTSFTVLADFTGTTSDPIFPQFTYDTALFALDGEIVRAGNRYTAKFKSLGGLAANTNNGKISFRLCRDSGCSVSYPGSNQEFTYSFDVKIADWTTRQRNAAHDGYVHATFDPATFAKAWEFAPAAAVAYDPVAARAGTVFLTQRRNDGSHMALALNSATGAERWHYSLGNVSDASGPALAGDQVLFSTMFTSSGNNPTVTLNATTGLFLRNFISAAQWSTFAQPTPFGDAAYIASGYYGNVVYGFDLANGVSLWQANGSGGKTWDGEAPAVDSRYVYYYSGNLDVIDRVTGALVKSIADPFWMWNGYSYGGTPMLGSNNHVIAYSGNGMGTYSSISFPLVDYDVEAGKYRWRTASGYSGTPAVAKGVIYAASNQTSQFDAIDEQTGKVLWSWPLPVGERFAGNVVVTDTLVFVSTDIGVYAIDLAGTHQTKWGVSTPGWLAITPEARLIVVPFNTSPTLPAKVTAWSLR